MNRQRYRVLPLVVINNLQYVLYAQADEISRSVNYANNSNNTSGAREGEPFLRWIINEETVRAELTRSATLVRALVTGDLALVRQHEEQLEHVLEACAKVRSGSSKFNEMTVKQSLFLCLNSNSLKYNFNIRLLHTRFCTLVDEY